MPRGCSWCGERIEAMAQFTNWGIGIGSLTSTAPRFRVQQVGINQGREQHANPQRRRAEVVLRAETSGEMGVGRSEH